MGLKADLRPGEKAVYIGLLRYHRNENGPWKLGVLDNYAADSKEFYDF
jgi:hypothetical protein